MVAASQSNCGFPDYGYSAQIAGGGGVTAGSGGTTVGGTGNTTGTAGGAGLPSGGGGASGGPADAGASGTGAAGDAGAAGSGCLYPTPVSYPDHCFDGKRSGDETGVDCGGTACVACVASPLMSLQFTSIVVDAYTSTPKFRLLLTYLGATDLSLSQIRVRYYFNHNGVSEPVIALNTQATLDPGNAPLNIVDKVLWTVHRFPLGPADNKGQFTDSYLEITFTSQALLTTGTKIDMTQDIVTGSPDTQFEQASHYSFLKGSLTTNNAITVYRGADRLLGVEPPMVSFPDCAFAHGVNVAGPSVTIDGQSIEGSAAAGAQMTYAGTPYSSSTPQPLPTTDAATATLLSTAFPLTATRGASWQVPNGTYWAYAWLTSAAGSDAGTLSLQGIAADKFYGSQIGSFSAWALLGPYPVSVNAGTLTLSATGKVNVAGLELYTAQH